MMVRSLRRRSPFRRCWMLEDRNDADAVSVNDVSHLPPLVTESEDALKDVTLREPRRQNGLKAQKPLSLG
jgi:hypothetical protein